MVRRLEPAAARLAHACAPSPVAATSAARPHMVEPPPAIVRGPVLRAIAPPGDSRARARDGSGGRDRPSRSPPAAASSASTSIGVWLTTSSSCLWLHTSHSSGAMLKSPIRIVGHVERLRPARHPLDEIELLAEFGVDLAVGNVAARGHIDILEPHAVRQPHADMPRLAIGLPVEPVVLDHRHAAEDRDAVVHPLAVDDDVVVAERAERRRRESRRRSPWFPAGTGCRARPRAGTARRCRCGSGPN